MTLPGKSTIPLPVRLHAPGAVLDADLCLPDGASALVIFAHGSGSSRHSPRNRTVAEALQRARLGTLLLDLLTEDEERTDVVTAEFRFDIPMLAARVVAALDWARAGEKTAGLPLGLFGASTGAAAALMAAAERPAIVRAVVSRGGRPDLADAALARVGAPTLLVVGGRDEVVIDLNRQAAARLVVENRVEIVPGATHLFEEPGALNEVALLAADWFARHLALARS